MVAKAAKDDRLDVRLSKEHKALIEQAAALEGQPVTSFAVSTLVERARNVVAHHDTTRLSAQDRKLFLKLLDEAEPTERLRKAARRFKTARG